VKRSGLLCRLGMEDKKRNMEEGLLKLQEILEAESHIAFVFHAVAVDDDVGQAMVEPESTLELIYLIPHAFRTMEGGSDSFFPQISKELDFGVDIFRQRK
jgi:hypothetical protein